MSNETTHDGFADVIKQTTNAVSDVAEKVAVSESRVNEIANELTALKVAQGNVRRDAVEAARVQAKLATVYGPSGAHEYLHALAKFLRAAHRKTRGMETDGDIGGTPLSVLVEKTAHDFTTTDAGYAGYLVPDILLPGIRELQHIYGNFYPLVTKVSVPAGQSVLINKDSVRPTATWRGTQAAAMTEEANGTAFTQGSIVTELLGTYVTIANEMLGNPSANFSAVMASRMLDGINKKLEDGLIKGTTGGGEPSDGIIADATSQGTIATMSMANLVTFLQSCIADNAYAFRTDRNKIFMTPADILALATEAVGASELTGMLVWGDPRKGVPTTVLGYEVVVHPSFDNGTNKHVMLGDPSTITLIEDPAFSVNFSEHVGFTDNNTVLRVLNHYDWNIGIAAEWHKAIVTA